MNNQNNSSQRVQRREFGGYLRSQIKKHWKRQKEAATDLGISAETLSYILSGRNIAPDDLLIIVSEKCGIPLEEILRIKYWPQLLLLTGIVDPKELTKNIVEELDEQELVELTRYAAFLLLRRPVTLEA